MIKEEVEKFKNRPVKVFLKSGKVLSGSFSDVGEHRIKFWKFGRKDPFEFVFLPLRIIKKIEVKND